MEADVDLEIIGKSVECNGYTGADLAALVREAGIQALKDFMVHNDPPKALTVSTEHFNRAVNKIRPSISEKVCCNNECISVKMTSVFRVISGPKALQETKEDVQQG